MKLTSDRMDFLNGVIRTAMDEGWTKEQFVRDVELSWHAIEALPKNWTAHHWPACLTNSGGACSCNYGRPIRRSHV